jgi:hypothetical protein
MWKGAGNLSQEPEIKSVPVGTSPLGNYFIGRQLI